MRNSSIAQIAPHLTARPPNLLRGVLEPFKFARCVNKPVSACVVVKGSGPRILLMGDSQAAMLVPLFTVIARREGLQLSVSTWPGCPWQRDLFTGYALRGCREIKENQYKRLLMTLHPNIVVVANLDFGTPGTFTGPLRDVHKRPVDFADVQRATERSLSQLRASGRRVVMIESLPIPVEHKLFDPLGCLAKADFLEACRFEAEVAPTRLEGLYRSLASQDRGVYSLDLDKEVCPLLPICDPVVNGEVVRFDALHLAVKFSESPAPDVNIRLGHGEYSRPERRARRAQWRVRFSS